MINYHSDDSIVYICSDKININVLNLGIMRIYLSVTHRYVNGKSDTCRFAFGDFLKLPLKKFFFYFMPFLGSIWHFCNGDASNKIYRTKDNSYEILDCASISYRITLDFKNYGNKSI